MQHPRWNDHDVARSSFDRDIPNGIGTPARVDNKQFLVLVPVKAYGLPCWRLTHYERQMVEAKSTPFE
jgi:hypothetical protein